MLERALAVKKIMEREHLPGTIKLWPGVAEELLGTKAYYVRAGVFKDVDVVLFAHVADNFRVAVGPTTNSGLVSVEYTFKGESAHAALAPWRGRSALDAVELMDIGWNFRREHLRLATRVHDVITNGGDQPNVVPPNAAVWYYYREADYDHIMNLWHIGDSMAQAAALMTDTTFTSRVLGTAAKIPELRLPGTGANEDEGSNPIGPTGGPSDDIGDISWVVPTVTLNYPSNIPGGPGHNWANGVSMATPIAHKGVVAGAKVQAMTMLDILLHPELVQKAWDYYNNVQTKDIKYKSLLRPDDQPATALNQKTMEEYRPRMKAFYYDASKYDTYLDQLGIKYPTVR